MGEASVTPADRDMLNPPESFEGKKVDLWRRLLRGGTNARRQDRAKLFYPFWIDPERKCIRAVGDYIPLGVSTDSVSPPGPGLVACWPIRTDDSEGVLADQHRNRPKRSGGRNGSARSLHAIKRAMVDFLSPQR